MILRHFFCALTAAVALTTGIAHAQTVTVSGEAGFLKPGMISVDTSVHGRAVSGSWEAMGTGVVGTSWTHQWPGVYFDAAFDGPEVILRFQDPYNHYDLIVDGKVIRRIDKPGSADIKVSGLGYGAHTIRLMKTSESQSGTGSFNGFFVPDADALVTPDASTRQIEFIGDSWTVGYGNTSDKRQCTPDELWSTTDTGKAFGPIVARHYMADFEINAFSGRGVVRNYNGVEAGKPLPYHYPHSLFNHESPLATNEAWMPRVIVIGLGTNDFSTALNAGEKWTTRAELVDDYVQSYVALVQGLRAHNPRARVLLLDTAEGEMATNVAEVAKRLTAAGDGKVSVVSVHGFELTGCDWHLSLKDDQKIADAIISAIDAQAGVWDE